MGSRQSSDRRDADPDPRQPPMLTTTVDMLDAMEMAETCKYCKHLYREYTPGSPHLSCNCTCSISGCETTPSIYCPECDASTCEEHQPCKCMRCGLDNSCPTTILLSSDLQCKFCDTVGCQTHRYPIVCSNCGGRACAPHMWDFGENGLYCFNCVPRCCGCAFGGYGTPVDPREPSVNVCHKRHRTEDPHWFHADNECGVAPEKGPILLICRCHGDEAFSPAGPPLLPNGDGASLCVDEDTSVVIEVN